MRSGLRGISFCEGSILKAVYQTITGRRLKLDNLSADERNLLIAIEKKFSSRPDWNEFALWWVAKFRRAQLPADSVVHRVCRDLEARLGIAQRKVAAPDYRDYLADLIEERFGSRYKFCEKAGIDPGQLSRVFASRADLSLPALQKILHVLGAALVIQEEDKVEAKASPDEASRALAAVTA
jgi:hypothetical protein